ncbi:ARMT1-like domain-containing protein [Fontivita pretiosa]|uniref:ARMT1-like domain-containing protein n=1 Tax=Fontivita pretiosa TaxID=2989684 RepID=UPI003D174E91
MWDSIKSQRQQNRRPFVKLADPNRYVACKWDLTQDHEAREYWVPFFIEHARTILRLGVEAAIARGQAKQSADDRARRCHEHFTEIFTEYLKNPGRHGVVTILTLDRWRDQIFREHGFIDPFIDLKDRENAKMLQLLPAVCRQIDATPDSHRLRAVIEGVFAGNIFDMGAAATAGRFLGSSPDFFEIRRTLPARPWLIDDFDQLEQVWHRKTYRKTIIFIDNAGSDFLLGVLPLARWLAMRGTQVVLAANEYPSLNDMTIHDVRAWWPRILRAEPSLASLPIESVSTGTGEPLIDLSEVSPDLNDVSADADLVIIEGMGRGVESNLDAEFSCDALNIAMIKDAMVAKRTGGKVFDVVCRFR